MTTMNVSLPKTLKKFVDERVSDGGYGSSSEYVRELIREDQIRQAKQQLAEMIGAGLASGEGRPITEKDWRAKRKRILGRMGAKS